MKSTTSGPALDYSMSRIDVTRHRHSFIHFPSWWLTFTSDLVQTLIKRITIGMVMQCGIGIFSNVKTMGRLNFMLFMRKWSATSMKISEHAWLPLWHAVEYDASVQYGGPTFGSHQKGERWGSWLVLLALPLTLWPWGVTSCWISGFSCKTEKALD